MLVIVDHVKLKTPSTIQFITFELSALTYFASEINLIFNIVSETFKFFPYSKINSEKYIYIKNTYTEIIIIGFATLKY